MRRSLLALSISLALSASALAQDDSRPVSDPSIPLTYVGSNARVSLGINNDGDIHGEGLGIFGFDGDSAWLGQLWLAEHGAGGVQFDYHWLWGGKTRQDTIDKPDSVRVAKAFVALDQNVWNDRKATVGVGYQKDDFFLDGYVSGAVSGNRQLGSTTDITTVTLTGVENGRPYTQVATTRTLIDTFERPYEKGIGVRLGQYVDASLLRLRGGLDYERGKYNSDQFTLSVGVDKYIRNTGWSLSLDAEHLKKTGDFERDKSDNRGWLTARYEFGQSFRASEPYRMVEVERTQVAAPVVVPQVMRNEVRLDGDAFFNFDKSDLRPDAVAALDELLAKLNGATRISRITVVGHTDSVGSDAYNQALSERRAASAKAYLIAHGVPADQVDTRGEGERNPSFGNDTAANRQKNRRVDVEFLTIEETTQPTAAVATPASVEWKKEPVAMPAAWIERALRNPAQHKRTVDVYRFERTSSDTTLGPRVFANRSPDAVNDSVTLTRDAAATPIAVLVNDSDPDGDVLSITAITAPAHGVATISGNVVNYTSSPGYVGSDTFTYSISDGKGGSDTATVTVTIGDDGDGNKAPIARPDRIDVIKGTGVDIPVLANDSDPDGDLLRVIAVENLGPHQATLTINPNGTIRFDHIHGTNGEGQIRYTITDDNGHEVSAIVTVVVTELPFG